MTFVLNGNIEHFDTATNVWTPIEEGGFQVIQSEVDYNTLKKS